MAVTQLCSGRARATWAVSLPRGEPRGMLCFRTVKPDEALTRRRGGHSGPPHAISTAVATTERRLVHPRASHGTLWRRRVGSRRGETHTRRATTRSADERMRGPQHRLVGAAIPASVLPVPVHVLSRSTDRRYTFSTLRSDLPIPGSGASAVRTSCTAPEPTLLLCDASCLPVEAGGTGRWQAMCRHRPAWQVRGRRPRGPVQYPLSSSRPASSTTFLTARGRRLALGDGRVKRAVGPLPRPLAGPIGRERTSNIEHPTSNVEWRRRLSLRRWTLGVQTSMLAFLIEACLLPPGGAC